MVEAAVDEPLVVPNFSCRRRTSRGGLATEFTNAIFTCRPAETDPQLINPKHHTVATSDPKLQSVKVSPTFWLVGVRRRDVLGEKPQALLALVVQPQIHLPPGLVLLRSLVFKVPLTVTLPQLVRILREPLWEEPSTKNVISLSRLTTHFTVRYTSDRCVHGRRRLHKD